METLGVLDVDGLDVGVETLLGVLLVVTLAGDADTETEGDTLDTGFPDLLVELGVDTDVLGTLLIALANRIAQDQDRCKLTIACSAKARISLMALGARFLKLTPWHYISGKEVTISLPPECHLQEKTLRDECLWSFGHSGLHKTNSSFVFRVRMCGCEKGFFKSFFAVSICNDR